MTLVTFHKYIRKPPEAYNMLYFFECSCMLYIFFLTDSVFYSNRDL